jgi:hypothetical protein
MFDMSGFDVGCDRSLMREAIEYAKKESRVSNHLVGRSVGLREDIS